MSRANPFAYFMGDIPVQKMDVETRLSAVKGFTAAQCKAALKVPGLQKAVERALDRRLDQILDHHHRTKGKGRKR